MKYYYFIIDADSSCFDERRGYVRAANKSEAMDIVMTYYGLDILEEEVFLEGVRYDDIEDFYVLDTLKTAEICEI